MKGLVHVYTGNGKGKTTASLGLALRFIGHGMKVCMIQFMKGEMMYGEQKVEIPNFEIYQYGRKEFVDKDNPSHIDIEFAKKALKHSMEAVQSGDYDLVILDEINVAIEWNLVDVDDVLKMIKKKRDSVELVLTGRYAPQEIIDSADYATEMREIKHPYMKGVPARRGIEY